MRVTRPGRGRRPRGKGDGMDRKGWRRPGMSPLAAFVLMALFVAVPALAQTTTATLRGSVQDQTSKKGVGAATVRAQSKTTGFHYDTVTADDGSFTLGGLPPGAYTVAVQAE